jgi:hypothetical protein
MLPPSVRIFVCSVPQDMRRSFDGPALATRQLVGQDPQSGALFTTLFVERLPLVGTAHGMGVAMHVPPTQTSGAQH